MGLVLSALSGVRLDVCLGPLSKLACRRIIQCLIGAFGLPAFPAQATGIHAPDGMVKPCRHGLKQFCFFCNISLALPSQATLPVNIIGNI